MSDDPFAKSFGAKIENLDWRTGITKHDQTHEAFLAAARLGISRCAALEKVAGKIRQSGGRLVERDVIRQLERSYRHVLGGDLAAFPTCAIPGGDGSFTIPPTAKFDYPKLLEFTNLNQGTVTREWLWQHSRAKPASAHEFLCTLYGRDERVAILRSTLERRPHQIWDATQADFGQLESEKGVFFLPNPIDGERHLVERLKSAKNSDGESWRCEEAVTVFRYLLLESDHQESEYPGFQEAWLKFLALLPVPIVSIVGSGGKSVHALVRVDTKSKADWDGLVSPFKNALVEFGADRGAMTAVRLSRLPFGVRNDRTQELLYCDPNADCQPILKTTNPPMIIT